MGAHLMKSRFFTLLFTLLILLSSLGVALATPKLETDLVLENEYYIRILLAKKMEKYAEALEACNSRKDVNTNLGLDHSALRKLKFTRDEIMNALIFLSEKNMQKCTHSELFEVFKANGRYLNFMKTKNLSPKKINYGYKNNTDAVSFKETNPYSPDFQDQIDIIFKTINSERYIAAEKAYEKLSIDKKKYLATIFGNKTFSFLKIIDDSELTNYDLN